MAGHLVPREERRYSAVSFLSLAISTHTSSQLVPIAPKSSPLVTVRAVSVSCRVAGWQVLRALPPYAVMIAYGPCYLLVGSSYSCHYWILFCLNETQS